MRRLTFSLSITLSGLLLLSPLSAQSVKTTRMVHINGQKVDALKNQVLVKFKTAPAAAAAGIHKMGSRMMGTNTRLGITKLQVPTGHTVESFLQTLQADPNVEFAEPNGVVRAFAAAPNDTAFSSQYYLQTGTGGIDILNAWDITTGSSNTVIAVIDSGVVISPKTSPTAHDDINDNLWQNPGTLTSTSGPHGAAMEIDWNGNGNCIGESDADNGPDQCASDDPNADDVGSYHGTHVAGIIAAETNNSDDIAGICRDCRIMAVKALNSSGAGTFSAIADGITYAVDNGATVINMSLGAAFTSAALNAAVAYAINNNVVVVAASGNNGAPCAVNYPAAIADVIAVGATDSSDQLASFSCGDSNLDLVAPGDDIVSLDATGTKTCTSVNCDGTSFASPMVAAVAGLLRSLDPNMSISDVTRYINFNADDLGAGGFDTSFGFGRLNAFKTLSAAQNGTPFVSNPASPNETFPYPNPFNPTSGNNVTISLPASLGSEGIKIEIYKLSGEKVKTLNGTVEWNGRNEAGEFVASGLYYYFAKTNSGDAKGKITLIK